MTSLHGMREVVGSIPPGGEQLLDLFEGGAIHEPLVAALVLDVLALGGLDACDDPAVLAHPGREQRRERDQDVPDCCPPHGRNDGLLGRSDGRAGRSGVGHRRRLAPRRRRRDGDGRCPGSSTSPPKHPRPDATR